ncbi:MAG: hypothetical protein LBF15_02440 [Candidatus Peribacteria bacterium]|jgi:hypothetical protein|nr:hypothetical protein [Candidatus Peribacteria bacterium]
MLAMYFILDNSAKEYLDAKGVISPASEAVSEIRASVENLLSTKTIENI